MTDDIATDIDLGDALDVVADAKDESVESSESVAPETDRKHEPDSLPFAGPLYVDIETVPDLSRIDLYDLPELPEIPEVTPADEMMPADEFVTQGIDAMRQGLSDKHPDEEWIEAAREAEQGQKKPRKGVMDLLDSLDLSKIKQQVAEIESQRNKIMSVTPEYCRIVALGWAEGNGDCKSIVDETGASDEREREMLEQWWDLVGRCRGRIIGFNVIGFDIRVLCVRSIMLNVEPSKLIDLKAWGKDVIDLMDARFGRGKAVGLKKLCALHGIKPPAEEVDGSQVYDLIRAGKGDEVAKYVESDVFVTREMHRLYRGFFCI